MTAEIVNLRKTRKAKARAEKERQAEANRARFGRTKGQRLAEEHDKQKASRALEGARREGTDGSDGGGENGRG